MLTAASLMRSWQTRRSGVAAPATQPMQIGVPIAKGDHSRTPMRGANDLGRIAEEIDIRILIVGSIDTHQAKP